MRRTLMAIAIALVTAPAAPAREKPAPLTPAQRREVTALLQQFRKAERPKQRQEVVRRILAVAPGAAAVLGAVVDKQLAEHEKQYVQLAGRYIPAAYVKRLTSLTDEQVRQVQAMRRLWKHYILTNKSQRDFQAVFLKPCWAVADLLLVKLEDATDPAVVKQRALLLEFAEYQKSYRAALGIDPDPTVGTKAPTGIPIPPLDQPPTYADYLSVLERSLVLADSVAPPGARRVLLANAATARRIDVQESEFVLYGNTVRMLVGSVAWSVDPLACAATRDHSADRKAGRASGHTSKIPEKRSFTMRCKRFGTSARSEGAGGGRDGRGYIHGLSYGGGHTGPLYSLKRNVVGVGRRGGVYTSVYRTDRRLLHPCQAPAGELFMPPGLSRKDIRSGALLAIHRSIYNRAFGRAHEQAAKARPESDRDKMILRFFRAAIAVEADHFCRGAEAVEAAGDLYELKRRLEKATRVLKGIPAFDTKAAEAAQRLAGDEAAKTLKIGAEYHKLARKVVDKTYTAPLARTVLEKFARKHPGTIYAEAARAALKKAGDKDDARPDPFDYFRTKSPALARLGYPAD